MPLRLIVDIGGTNARFCLTESGNAGTPTAVSRYSVADFPDFEAAATAFLREQGADAGDIAECVIAAAGPLENGTIALTNAPWVLSQSGISERLGGAKTRLLNDLEAIGYLLPLLGSDEIETIAAGNPPEGTPLIAVNVGTGFNSSIAIPVGEDWTVVTAESGHAALPQSGELSARGTVESILSGPGIARLREQAPEGIERVFSTALGVCVRNLILNTGSWGGVYLCGGVMLNAPEMLDRNCFLQQVRDDEGPMAAKLSRVPVHRITTPDPTLKALARLSF